MTRPRTLGTIGVGPGEGAWTSWLLGKCSCPGAASVGRIVVATNQAAADLQHGLRDSTVELSPGESDLVEIVAAARAGSDAAWETLIERFHGLVAAIARRCRLSDADVAEVCQTTWLRLVQNLDRIEQPDRLGAWLATTSRRESLRIATRRTVLSLNDAVYLLADDDADPLDFGLLRDEQLAVIRMATQRL